MHTCVDHKICVEDALKTADEICQENGSHFTDLRRKVLEMVLLELSPAKAYDILDKLKGGSGSAKPPTVYRTLDFLMENGLVHKLNSLNAYVGCSHPSMCHECYFLICGECGEATECCNDDLSELIFKTAGQNNFDPKHITLEISGICQDCMNH